MKNKKTAQDIQDEIFRKMSADRKIELGSQLWQLAKDLVGSKKEWFRKLGLLEILHNTKCHSRESGNPVKGRNFSGFSGQARE